MILEKTIHFSNKLISIRLRRFKDDVDESSQIDDGDVSVTTYIRGLIIIINIYSKYYIDEDCHIENRDHAIVIDITFEYCWPLTVTIVDLEVIGKEVRHVGRTFVGGGVTQGELS